MAVYFIQAVDGGPIKIGFTANIGVRLKQLESTYERPLALLRSIPGGRIEEHDIHSRFAHLRLSRTEQFRPDPELLNFIGRPLFVSVEPVVEAMEPGSKTAYLDAEVVRVAKIVAAYRSQTLAEYLTSRLAPLVESDLSDEQSRQAKPKPPRR